MFSRRLHRYVLAISVILVLAIAAFARPAAQPPQAAPAKMPTVYTYISFFGVPRANWAEYEKDLEKDNKAMASQLANGNLVSWGNGALEVHEGLNAPTHVSWMSSMIDERPAEGGSGGNGDCAGHLEHQLHRALR